MGPISPATFEGLITDGTVKTDTLVWSATMSDWQPFGQIAAETATCAASGGRYWQRDMVPYEGKFVSAEHKEEFFQRLREGVQQPGTVVYGNFWPRVLAKLIDGIVAWVASMAINFGLAMLFFGQFIFQPKPNNPLVAGKFWAFQGTAFLLSLCFGLAYYWFFLNRYAATPGKMVLGLKIVRSNGSALSTGRIIGRFFAERLSAMILCIGYLMVAFDEERRGLHDQICDTRVIKTR